jgi:hypothetical protein
LGYFTYTASQQATILVTTTNNCGWIDPVTTAKPLVISTIPDPYAGLTVAPTNIYGLYRRYTAYDGPAITLQRPSDNTNMTFNFNNAGNLPRQAIQDWGGRTFKVVEWFDQSPSGNNVTFTGIPPFGVTGIMPSFDLVNTAGYPDIEAPSGFSGTFNTPINNQNLFTSIARLNNSGGSAGLYRMDIFTGPIIWGLAGGGNFEIFSTGSVNHRRKEPSKAHCLLESRMVPITTTVSVTRLERRTAT